MKTMITSQVKLAVISQVLPPSFAGQAVGLYRVLRDIAPDDYCLLSNAHHDAYATSPNSSTEETSNSWSKLPARYHRLPREEIRLNKLTWGGFKFAPGFVKNLLKVYLRARRILNVVKRENCGAILACSGDLHNLPAGYLTSRWADVPFYAYIFDDYLYQWTEPGERMFARYAEAIIFKNVAGAIVLNEFLRDEYYLRYQVRPIIIRTPYEPPETNGHKVSQSIDKSAGKIVFTGAVYQAHYDAFRNLMAALRQLNRPEVKLHLYTAQSPDSLEQAGIYGPIVFHDQVPLSEAIKVQQQADILFLPLAFNSPIPEVIKTSAPTKMGEYLVSGRPILVHAPADAFISWYFKEHLCGAVVDQSEPAALAHTIQRIVDDADWRQQLEENACVRARVDFDPAGAQAKFLRLIQPRDNK